MHDKLKLIAKTLGEERVKFGESLRYHTFTKSEGEAEGFFIATNKQELIKILDISKDLNIPFFIIGNGTKIFISKEGLSGLVIKNRTASIKKLGVKGKVGRNGIDVEEAIVEVDSGVSLRRLNEYLEKEKLKKIDGFSSLYSTIGGAMFIDSVLRKSVQKLEIWDVGVVSEIGIDELDRETVILSATFKIKAEDNEIEAR